MYEDFYLKFSNDDEAKSVLYTVIPAVLDEDGEVVSEETVKPNFMNIDTLGVLYEPSGSLDEDGYPILQPMQGWHVNVLVIDGEDATGLQQYAVVPSVPRRVWG